MYSVLVCIYTFFIRESPHISEVRILLVRQIEESHSIPLVFIHGPGVSSCVFATEHDEEDACEDDDDAVAMADVDSATVKMGRTAGVEGEKWKGEGQAGASKGGRTYHMISPSHNSG